MTTIQWTPRAKQRPRTTVKSGKAVTFTPPETREAEKRIREQWTAPPEEGPISVIVVFRDTDFDIEVAAADEPVSKKLRGDLDNYAKTVLDALNGVAWVDDKQIVSLYLIKE
jgi:crossover junction endodeoxyribonuclease RusA